LSICQLHILLSRTAQISLQLHFCVELHTKKSPAGAHTTVRTAEVRTDDEEEARPVCWSCRAQADVEASQPAAAAAWMR